LSTIHTGFLAGSRDIELEDKHFGKDVVLPKHARTRDACAVVFHVGEPETVSTPTTCRTSVGAHSNPETVLQDVTHCQLAKDPSAFSGKRIRVRAIYRYIFEMQRLESPGCCPDRMDKTWVEIGSGLEGHSLKQFKKFPRGMGIVLAVFVGKFDAGGPYGDGGYRFQLTVDRIDAVEGTSRSSRRQDDPAWVPKNCETSNAELPSQNVIIQNSGGKSVVVNRPIEVSGS
jgi:hypothetical protein